MKQRKRRIYKSWEMRKGGNQLAEIMELDFPYEYIEEHGDRLGLDYDKLKRLKLWVDKRYSVRLAMREIRQQTGIYFYSYLITDFFRGTGSLLHKLARELDPTPRFDDNGELIRKYSFINYDEYRIEDSEYRVVETTINRELFWRDRPSKSELRKFEKTYIYRFYKGGWNQTQTQFAKDYLEAMKKLKML